MSDLSTIEAKQLLQLCRTGRLFEIQKWIASGKSLNVSANLRTTPIEVALDTGFHSLVELLVRNEESQELKNRALSRAVSIKRSDFVELLVSHGANVKSVPFIDVLEEWDPTIIRYFLDHGADFITDFPFAIAFGQRIRTAIRPWRDCKEKYPEAASELQQQADRALRHFCQEGNLKWVSLLMWAGADPRACGPALDDYEDESEDLTALKAASYCKNVEVLKRLRPDPKRDDLDHLLTIASSGARSEVVRYLLGLGAKPNDKANGGSSALDSCLERFRFESFVHSLSFTSYSSISKASKYSVSETRATIQLLLEHGALWRPDDVRALGSVRRGLFDCEPAVTLELVERLLHHLACSQDTLQNLLRTPAMKNHLIPVARKFVSMGLDVRTKEQKAEEERQADRFRRLALSNLARRYNREKIYEEIWTEPLQHVAKRYSLSDTGLAKVCRKLRIPRPGRGYWAMKAASKHIPRQPALPELVI